MNIKRELPRLTVIKVCDVTATGKNIRGIIKMLFNCLTDCDKKYRLSLEVVEDEK